MDPVLVTGATGNVGRPVVLGLLAAGRRVRAAVRDPAGVSGDPELAGAQAVAFDFTDPLTWAAAFVGVRVMFLVRPPQLSNWQRDLLPSLQAARRAGVRHVVFLSVQGAEKSKVVPHAGVEKWLRTAGAAESTTPGSGMDWTFLRPSFFMQNLSTTHRCDIRDRDEVFVPAGRGRTAFVDASDIAAVAVEVLTHPADHVGRAWTLTGSVALTYDEVATALTRELGRPIRYRRPGVFRYARHARRALDMPWAMVLVNDCSLHHGAAGAGCWPDGRRPDCAGPGSQRDHGVCSSGTGGLAACAAPGWRRERAASRLWFRSRCA